MNIIICIWIILIILKKKSTNSCIEEKTKKIVISRINLLYITILLIFLIN